MSLVTLQKPDFVGLLPWQLHAINAPSPTVYQLDAAGEKQAWVLQIPKTGTLARIHFRTTTVTSAQDLKVSFQDLDASGDPDGGVDQFRVYASASVVANTTHRTGLITSDGTDTGTKRSVTAGQRIAVVIEFNSATGNVTLSTGFANASANVADSYEDRFTAAWSKAATAMQALAIALEYDDGSVVPVPGTLVFCGSGTTQGVQTVTFNSGSTPDERGNRFLMPYTAEVSFLWAFVDYDNAVDLVLYDTNGTSVLGSASAPAAAVRGNAAQGLIRLPITPVTLLKSGVYRVAVKPTSVSNVGVVLWTAFDNATLGGHTGVDFHSTTRVDGGSWTESNNQMHSVGPVVTAVDSGGGRRPRMRTAA